MWATLPLVVGALHRADPHFGRVLGRLYGWNTLGAVLGALAGEAWLLERFGIRGTAALAGAANAVAAAGALALARRAEAAGVDAAASRIPELPRAAWGVLFAAFAAGFALLGLEVIWFRIALLYVRAESLSFATMLALVLAGIGLGGLAGGRLLGRSPRAAGAAAAVALAAGALVVSGYALLREPAPAEPWLRAATLALELMFPVALASGLLFALLGGGLDRLVPAEARLAGLLTLANRVGAMRGAVGV